MDCLGLLWSPIHRRSREGPPYLRNPLPVPKGARPSNSAFQTTGEFVAMSKDMIDETLAIAGDLKNQLKFYVDIGLEDIGGSAFAEAPPSDIANSLSDDSGPVDLLQEPQLSRSETRAQDVVPAPYGASQLEQTGLFGESNTAPKPGIPHRVGSTLPVLDSRDDSLEAIREDIGDCVRCKLHEHRKTIVFGEGNPQARLVFVGEGPGADEDASGRPFVGRAGQLLDKIICAIGMKSEAVYIAH